MSVYVDLTREFNESEPRAVLSSGQAVVLSLRPGHCSRSPGLTAGSWKPRWTPSGAT